MATESPQFSTKRLSPWGGVHIRTAFLSTQVGVSFCWETPQNGGFLLGVPSNRSKNGTPTSFPAEQLKSSLALAWKVSDKTLAASKIPCAEVTRAPSGMKLPGRVALGAARSSYPSGGVWSREKDGFMRSESRASIDIGIGKSDVPELTCFVGCLEKLELGP